MAEPKKDELEQNEAELAGAEGAQEGEAESSEPEAEGAGEARAGQLEEGGGAIGPRGRAR